MAFTLTISTDNAAFADDEGAEVARILREAADAIEGEAEQVGHLYDVNGNRVGFYAFT